MPTLDIFAAITTVVGALTALFGFWKFLKPALKLLKNLGTVVSQADKHTKLIEQIAAELKPNGGNSVRDILDRLEKDMVSFDSKIKTLIIYNDVALYETDVSGNCLWVSKEWCRVTGLLPSDASGNGWVVCIHEGDRDRVFEEWKNAVEQQRDFNMNYRVGNDSIGFTVVLGRANAIKNAKGKLLGYIGTIEPLSDSDKPAPPDGSSLFAKLPTQSN